MLISGEIIIAMLAVCVMALAVTVMLRRPPAILFPSLMATYMGTLVWTAGEYLTSFGTDDFSSYWIALVAMYAGVLSIPPAWWIFAVRFSEFKGHPIPWARGSLLYAPVIPAILFWIVCATNPWHESFIVAHVHARNEYLPLWYASFVFILATLAMAVWAFVRLRLVLTDARSRQQMNIIILATTLPVATNALYVSGLVSPGYDLTVVGLVGSSLLFAVGIYRDRLFALSAMSLRKAVESAEDGLIMLDVDGLMLYANEPATRFLQPHVVRHQDDIVPVVLQRLKQEGGIEELLDIAPAGGRNLFECDKAESPWVHVETVKVADRHGNAKGYAIWIRDVSEIRSLESQLLQAQKLDALGTLAGGIAHDFNNILQALLANCETADTTLRSDPDQAHEALVEIRKSGLRAADLVSQILTFSRSAKIDVEVVELQPVVHDAIRFLESSFPATVDVQEKLPSDALHVRCNSTQIYQVIINLGTNSLHGLNDGTGVISIGLEQRTLKKVMDTLSGPLPVGDYVEISVSDTGCGIHAEVLPKVLDPFFTTKEPGSGTGLGLAVVHGIVKRANGGMLIESVVGKGTTVRVLLPLLSAHDAPAPRVKRSESVGQGSGNILVVDDEEPVVAACARVLERQGYFVQTFTDPNQAAAHFSNTSCRYRLAILDYMMPRMTGLELARRLQEVDPTIVVVFATGMVDSEEIASATDVRVREVLAKPYTMHQLISLVSEVMSEVEVGEGIAQER